MMKRGNSRFIDKTSQYLIKVSWAVAVKIGDIFMEIKDKVFVIFDYFSQTRNCMVYY